MPHAELPDGGGMVGTHCPLLGVEAHAFADVRVAALAPNVEGHLEPGGSWQ